MLTVSCVCHYRKAWSRTLLEMTSHPPLPLTHRSAAQMSSQWTSNSSKVTTEDSFVESIANCYNPFAHVTMPSSALYTSLCSVTALFYASSLSSLHFDGSRMHWKYCRNDSLVSPSILLLSYDLCFLSAQFLAYLKRMLL